MAGFSDFKNLGGLSVGDWPLAPKIALLMGVFLLVIGVLVGAVWYPIYQDIEDKKTQEETLKAEWIKKKKLAVNAEPYRRQLDEINRQFGVLLKQLPNRAEMDQLLAEVNQAGLGRGLQFELFKPGVEVVRDFYAEQPISIKVSGRYDDIGAFSEDLGKMPRIVSLTNLQIDANKDNSGPLKFDATVLTYRYLDEAEVAAQKKVKEANMRGGQK